MSVTRVILPKLGLTMDEGKLVAWRKAEGDRVAPGDVLFEVETDKATMEVEAGAAGIVRKLLAREGDTIPVTNVIAYISDTADEPLPAEATSVEPARPSSSGGIPRSSGRVPAGRAPSDAPSATGDGGRIAASPAAKKRAAELGVDLTGVRGSGPGGRITIEDVEAAAGTAPAAPSTGERRQPLGRIRRAVAEHMARASREAPQFTVSRDVEMTAANERRKAAGVSYTDVIIAACAAALRAHPRFRARFDGDAIVVSDAIHVGIAVALDDGLIVPVLRDADRKDLASLEREREGLEDAARRGKLPAGALTGAVFTLSNLGPFGVDRFDAIVNAPESAILAVGRVADRVVARDGAPAVRPMVTLTLSVDHRVADGADAARFLADVARHLESGA